MTARATLRGVKTFVAADFKMREIFFFAVVACLSLSWVHPVCSQAQAIGKAIGIGVLVNPDVTPNRPGLLANDHEAVVPDAVAERVEAERLENVRLEDSFMRLEEERLARERRIPGVTLSGTVFLDRKGGSLKKDVDGQRGEARLKADVDRRRGRDEPGLVNVEVALEAEGVEISKAVTDEKGHYSFDGVPADETYTVRVLRAPPGTVSRSPSSLVHVVNAIPGEATPDLDFAYADVCPVPTMVEVIDHGAFAANPDSLTSIKTWCGSANNGWRDFGQEDCDWCFGDTFSVVPPLSSDGSPTSCYLSGAKLVVEMKVANWLPLNIPCSLSTNDVIQLYSGGVRLWAQSIEDVLGSSWSGPMSQSQLLVLDLANLPIINTNNGSSSDIIAGINGDLQVFIQDDTLVDSLTLNLEWCCPPSLSGFKYEDSNANGQWDAGEAKLEDWEITIEQPDGTVATVTTDSNGYYSFDGNQTGVYTVSEVQQPNWYQFGPLTNDYQVNLVGVDSVVGNLNFGNFPCENVSEELCPDALDLGVGDQVTVNGDLQETMNGYPGGQYSALGQATADHVFGQSIEFDVPDGCAVIQATLKLEIDFGGGGGDYTNDWIHLMDPGGGAVWSRKLQDLVGGTPGVHTLSLNLLALPLATGTDNILPYLQDGKIDLYIQDDTGVLSFKFCYKLCCECLPGTICITKYEDLDRDGQRDANEPGLPGWEFHILGATMSSVGQTDKEGRLCFSDLEPGIYTIEEVQQAGWVQTAPSSVIQTVEICGKPGEANVTFVEFGNSNCECESNRKSECIDADIGAAPGKELFSLLASLPNGFTTQLDDPTPNMAFGHTFKNMHPPGCLVVGAKLTLTLRAHSDYPINDKIYLKEGATTIWSAFINTLASPTAWNPGAQTSIVLDLTNLTGGNGPSNVLALLADGDLDFVIQDDTAIQQACLVVDYCCDASISGIKYEDKNGNGAQDPGEGPLQGVTVNLEDPASGVGLGQTVTDSQGHYSFDCLEPGKYLVSEVPPFGWTQLEPVGPGYYVGIPSGHQQVGSKDFGNYRGPCTNPQTVKCVLGDDDNTPGGPGDHAQPDADLYELMTSVSSGVVLTALDVAPTNQPFGHTFRCWNQKCKVVGARLTISLMAGTSSLTTNDKLYLFDGVQQVWSQHIDVLTGSPWSPGSTAVVVLDLATLPGVLASMQDGDLSIMVQDDTGVDSMYLEVDVCCEKGNQITIDPVELSSCEETCFFVRVSSEEALTGFQVGLAWGQPGVDGVTNPGYGMEIVAVKPGPDVPDQLSFFHAAVEKPEVGLGAGEAVIALALDATAKIPPGTDLRVLEVCVNITGTLIREFSKAKDHMADEPDAVEHDVYVLNDLVSRGELRLCIVDGLGVPAKNTTLSVSRDDDVVSVSPDKDCVDLVVRDDTTPPVVSCPDDIVISGADPEGAVVIYDFDAALTGKGTTAAVAADDCGEVEIKFFPPSGSVFPPGVTEVTCEVTDTSGNVTVCTFEVTVRAGEFFRRGDVNSDGVVDITDGILALESMFQGGSTPICPDAMDAYDDGNNDMSDPVTVFAYLFLGAAQPPAPGPSGCGPDLTEDSLGPCEYTLCE
jgi:hypothetical protein